MQTLTMLGVSFTFSEDVSTSLAASHLTFQNTTNATGYPSTLASTTGNTTTFGFGTMPAIRGDYIATLARLGVTDLAGNLLPADATVSFFVLPGDADRSRSVDFSDLLALAQHYGAAGNFAQGDFNYNGSVGFDDLLILAQNYGTSLLTAPLAKAAAPTTARKRSTASSIVG